MRIALVVEQFESRGGGVEQVVWNLARHLAELGDDVHVIARRGTTQPNVRSEWVHTPSVWQPARVLGFARRSADALNEIAPDVSHAFAQVPGCDVFHAGGGSHATYMAHTYGFWGRGLRRLSPRHALLLALQRRIFGDPRLLVQCVSPLVRDDIATRFGVAANRLVVLPPGVDTARFRPVSDAERSATRFELGAGSELATDHEPLWLFAGSGWRRKGLDTAIRALAHSANPAARLWVAGKDATRPWEALAQRSGVADRVHFLGPRDDLERLYGAADALVFPTRYDGFGLVCLEAAACGLPVVTSKRAGAWELLREAAIVVEAAEDPRSFAAALDRVEAEGLRAKLGEAGRRIAERNRWADAAVKLRECYATIAARRRDCS